MISGTVIVVCLLALTLLSTGWATAWFIQGNRKENLEEKWKTEQKLLEEKCVKLADHVLWMEHDETLGGKMDLALIPSKLKELSPVFFNPPRNGIDKLLDAIEVAVVTGVKSEPHYDKDVNSRCSGLDPLVILEFGEVAIRDMMLRDEEWTPDIIWRGNLLPRLTEIQSTRAKMIFDNKMAEKAEESLKPYQLPLPNWNKILGE